MYRYAVIKDNLESPHLGKGISKWSLDELLENDVYSSISIFTVLSPPIPITPTTERQKLSFVLVHELWRDNTADMRVTVPTSVCVCVSLARLR